MPPVSPAQKRLMEAASHTPGGYGGVPQKVGKEFLGKDMSRSDWRDLMQGLVKFLSEEENEPEHQEAADESEKANAEGKLSEKDKEAAGRIGSAHREDEPEDTFLEPGERKYPVKENGKYDRRLLLAAAREARMHGHEDLAKRADAIRAREFGGAEDTAAHGAVERLAYTGPRLAADKAGRTYDENGYLHVGETNISKACVNPYRGDEIPNGDTLGLDPSKIYKLLRDPEELARAAPTFDNMPLLTRHKPQSSAEPSPMIRVGSTGTGTHFDHPYLKTPLVIWDDDPIVGVETGQQRELSSSYRYDADMTPGTYEGQSYDGVMRNIRGNHVALVETGRAGSDVLVGDTQLKETSMPKAALSRRAVFARGALHSHLRPLLAADTKLDLTPVVSGITKQNWRAKKPTIAAAVRAMTKGKLAADTELGDIEIFLGALDEDMDDKDMDEPKKKAEDEKDEDKDDEDDADGAEDEAETEEEKKARMEKRAADKKAKDEAESTEKDKEKEKEKAEDKKAMDAQIDRRVAAEVKKIEQRTIDRMRAIQEAERAVRPYVGDIVIAQDSAEDVYRLALETSGVDLTDVHPSAFRAMIGLLPKPGESRQLMASDSARASSAESFFKKFNIPV